MKAITKYQAIDGSEWNSPEKAEARDRLVDSVNKIMAMLKPTPEKLNWDGYVQQNAATIAGVKERLYSLANVEGVLKWWIDSQKQGHGKTDYDLIHLCHPSWFCRMLDGDHGPLDRAYHRLCCIDVSGREWNQPFCANNPPSPSVCVG